MKPQGAIEPQFDEPGFIAALRRGDDAAYERLVREVSGRLLAVARRMLRNEDEAMDAVQEAFLSAFRALGQFDEQSKLSTWLHRITVNACLMRLRSKSRRPERAIEDLLPTFDSTGHQSESSARWKLAGTAGIEAGETRALVQRAIDELPDAYRTVVMLRDVEGLSTEEAAQVLQVTPNTVKIRLHRARLALRQALDPHLRGDAES